MTASHLAGRTVASGVVVGPPRRWLGLEGFVLLAGALIAYGALGQPWWIVPAGILVPDIAMAGYLAGTRHGARLYNLAHATLLPAVRCAVASTARRSTACSGQSMSSSPTS